MNKMVSASAALVVFLVCFLEAQGNGNMIANTMFLRLVMKSCLFPFLADIVETNRNASDPDPVPATTTLTETTVAHDCHTDADCPENCFCVYRAKRGRKVCRSLLGTAFKGMCNVWGLAETITEPMNTGCPNMPLYYTWIWKQNKDSLADIFTLSLCFLSARMKSWVVQTSCRIELFAVACQFLWNE